MSLSMIHAWTRLFSFPFLFAVIGLVPMFGGAGCSSEEADATTVSSVDRIESARAKLQKEGLGEEERRAARREMGQAFRAALDDNVREYFAAGEEDRVAILDRQIDAFTERMKAWEARRAEREARRAKEAKEGGAKEGDEGVREGRRGSFANSTREERKDRAESRDPDQSARRMAYFSAVRKRAQERGIEMPSGRRGGSSGGNRGGGRGRPGRG